MWMEVTPSSETCDPVDVAVSGELIAVSCFGETVQIYSRSAAGTWNFRTEFDAGWIDFGYSLDLQDGSPPKLLVGALGFLGATGTDGCAFYYEFGATPSSWNLRATLVPRDHRIDDGNRFALDVEILEDGRLAVGAPTDFWGSGDGAPIAGAAYVFAPDAFGTWVETLRFTSSIRVNGERFGDVLAGAGDRLIVGSGDVTGGNVNGAFYAFDTDG
mgnify:CR=1 FL=1